MGTVKTYGGGKIGTQEVDESVIASRVLGRTLKEVLVNHEANQRQGNAKTKERGEVSGSHKKPWKQKHTGRARAGFKRSPIWRGGGTVFGPRTRSFYTDQNKKQKRVALASALLGKLQDEEVFVVDGFPTQKPSTKEAVKVLEAVGADRGALVVTAELDRNAWLSLRNVACVDVMPLADINAHAVLLRKNVIFTPAAFDQLLSRKWSQKTSRTEVNDG